MACLCKKKYIYIIYLYPFPRSRGMTGMTGMTGMVSSICAFHSRVPVPFPWHDGNGECSIHAGCKANSFPFPSFPSYFRFFILGNGIVRFWITQDYHIYLLYTPFQTLTNNAIGSHLGFGGVVSIAGMAGFNSLFI